MSYAPKDDFIEYKKKLMTLVNSGLYKEITINTKGKICGIYMLYVDNFEDDKIIPVYIGQSIDIVQRYKSHVSEIYTINRFKYITYAWNMLRRMYEGSYKACKIFSYMVNHNCKLSDLKMILLEDLTNHTQYAEEELFTKEYSYINEYKTSYFGFNQLNTTTLMNSSRWNNNYRIKNYTTKNYFLDVTKDIENIVKYQEYGYNIFNLYLNESAYKTKKQYKEIMNNKNYIAIKASLDESSFCKEKMNNIRNALDEINKEVRNILFEQLVKPFFERNGLRNKERMEELYRGILKNNLNVNLVKYIQKYSKKEKMEILYKEIENKRNIFEELDKQYNTLSKKYLDLRDEYYEKGEKIFCNLWPKKYSSHPLKDSYKEHIFSIQNKNDVLYINIEYTRKNTSRYYGYPILIDCLYINDNSKIRTQYFIKTGLEKYCENKYMHYDERDKFNYYALNKNPFNLVLLIDDKDMCVKSEIPVTMELLNGINEYTLSNKEMYNLNDALKKIDEMINEKTEVIYSTKGTKECINKYLYDKEIKNTKIATKLQKITFKKRS